jgi:plasmid stability protein
MKNVTLSIPEELLRKSREYAQKHGTSLNEFIRTLLRQAVTPPGNDPVQKLIDNSDRLKVSTKDWKWNRDELYDRKIFS